MMRIRTLLPAGLLGVALVLSACGTEPATDTGADTGSAAEPGSGTDSDTPEVSSGDGTASDPGAAERESVGQLLVNQRLDVPPANYPLPDVPTQAVVSDTAELATVFATAPGIDEVVAKIDAASVPDGNRLFAYLVNACTTADLSLELKGGEVVTVVHGTSTLRCAPPTTMIVWSVGDNVPADATAGMAVQK